MFAGSLNRASGRRKKTAAERRAQRLRAQARHVGWILKAVNSLQHRGSRPTETFQQLAATLEDGKAPVVPICWNYPGCRWGSDCRYRHIDDGRQDVPSARKCSRCGQTGHNVRTCTARIDVDVVNATESSSTSLDVGPTNMSLAGGSGVTDFPRTKRLSFKTTIGAQRAADVISDTTSSHALTGDWETLGNTPVVIDRMAANGDDDTVGPDGVCTTLTSSDMVDPSDNIMVTTSFEGHDLVLAFGSGVSVADVFSDALAKHCVPDEIDVYLQVNGRSFDTAMSSMVLRDLADGGKCLFCLSLDPPIDGLGTGS